MLSAIAMSTGDVLPGPEGLRKGSIATAAATGTNTSHGTVGALVRTDAGGQRLSIGGDAIISVRPRCLDLCPDRSWRRQASFLPWADGGSGRTFARADTHRASF